MKRALFFVAMAACGGRTSVLLDDALASTPLVDAGGPVLVDAGSPICQADGVRLCGGACEDAGCGSCTPVYSESGALDVGVCWGDLSDYGDTPCAFAGIGEGCIERTHDHFVVIPLAVAAAVNLIGGSGSTWFADRSPYNGEPIPEPPSCDVPSYEEDGGFLCGTDCNVSANTAPACLGVGPSNPMGFYAGQFVTESPALLGYPTCALAYGDASAVSCVPSNDPSAQVACTTLSSAASEPRVAAMTGICLASSECAAISKTSHVSCRNDPAP